MLGQWRGRRMEDVCVVRVHRREGHGRGKGLRGVVESVPSGQMQLPPYSPTPAAFASLVLLLPQMTPSMPLG